MTDKKISDLTSATTPLGGTETLPIVQNGTTKNATVSDLTTGRNVVMRNATIGIGGSTNVGTGVVLNGTDNSGNGSSIVATRNGAYAWILGDYAAAMGSGTGYLTFTFGSAPTVFYNQSAGEQLRLDGSDVKASYGNFVPSTAAKGINFTANTPAAGMTSQLLNWYEEGTWTPTRYGFTEVLGAGSITVSGTYTRVGRMVTVIASIIPAGGATIAATAGIGSYLSGLPFMVATPCPGVWVDSSSVAANGGILANATELYIATAWSASVNVKRISATYFV